MAEAFPPFASPGQQDLAMLESYEEDLLPSLPISHETFRSFDPHTYYTESSDAKRSRRLSNATTTSIGRPRYLATPAKSVSGRESADPVTFARDVRTQELSTFLWTHNPPSSNWVSEPEGTSPVKKEGWYWRRPKVSSSPLQLPDCAVARKTATGHWYIAIHVTTPPKPDPDTYKSTTSKSKAFDAMSITSRGLASRINSKVNRYRGSSVSTVKTARTINTVKDIPTAGKSVKKLQKDQSSPAQVARRPKRNSSQQPLPAWDGFKAPEMSQGTQSRNPPATSISEFPTSTITNDNLQKDGQETPRPRSVRQITAEKRPTIVHSTSRDSIYSVEGVEKPLSDLPTTETIRNLRAGAIAPPKDEHASDVTGDNSTPDNPFEKARAAALYSLEQAQIHEKDAQAVVLKAERETQTSIPALEDSITRALTKVKEARSRAAQAMEDAEVETAISAAKEAAEVQATITASQRQLSASKIHLQMLLSAANSRLVEARDAGRAATTELHNIALAEAEAERERLKEEERNKARLAAEQKAEAERLAKERAEALAVAEAKALAEVRAAFARADQEAATERQKVESMQAMREMQAKTAIEQKRSSVQTARPLPSLSVPRDPEVYEMQTRLRNMESDYEAMRQTLSALLRVDKPSE
ncbi:hypothetical protein VTL71DRAFT_5871 [Oculimacula yallundae]|uniref:Uncharacterized protein n=1 Tax=Oculimacula yallundae TaxID=86028 RepID=A0ABR4BYR7_9HELO